MKLPLHIRTSTPASVDVLAFGENSVDLVGVVNEFPSSNSKIPLIEYTELPGGEAATAAVGLARLGWRAKYVGRFGDDRLGTFALRQLEREQVDVDDAIVVEQTTNRLAIILVDRQTGDRTVLWRRADQLCLKPDDLPEKIIANARVLLVGSDDVDAMAAAAERARRHDVCTVGDLEHVQPHTTVLLEHLDAVIMASSFPTRLTGDPHIASALRKVADLSGAPFVCVTLGADGCLAYANGREFHVPSFRVPVRDTTGAGDLFRAGLIAYLLREPEKPQVEEALRYANAVAGLGCREVGAQTAAPRAAEVEALLNS